MIEDLAGLKIPAKSCNFSFFASVLHAKTAPVVPKRLWKQDHILQILMCPTLFFKSIRIKSNHKMPWKHISQKLSFYFCDFSMCAFKGVVEQGTRCLFGSSKKVSFLVFFQNVPRETIILFFVHFMVCSVYTKKNFFYDNLYLLSMLEYLRSQ